MSFTERKMQSVLRPLNSQKSGRRPSMPEPSRTKGLRPRWPKHAVIETPTACFRAVWQTARHGLPAIAEWPKKPLGGWFSGSLMEVRRRIPPSVSAMRTAERGSSGGLFAFISASPACIFLSFSRRLRCVGRARRGRFRRSGGGAGADRTRRDGVEFGWASQRDRLFQIFFWKNF